MNLALQSQVREISINQVLQRQSLTSAQIVIHYEHMTIETQIKKFLVESSKSILLLGPRQTGKSTLVCE